MPASATNIAPHRLRVPGDKSISHRALILAALGEGVSQVQGILNSADVRASAQALRLQGVEVLEGPDVWKVTGVTLRGLQAPSEPIDCGNSGTTARLLAGVIAGAGTRATLVGDESLSRRPMRRVVAPLTRMGAEIRLTSDGTLPMELFGGALHEIEWDSEVASAQVKSAILLAALIAGVPATVREPQLSRDHTERMLASRGVRISSRDGAVRLEPASSLPATDVRVPADPSSAAFPAAFAAAGGAGLEGVELPDVCISPARAGFLAALERMGASISVTEQEGWEEPVATLVVRPSELRGITVEAGDVPGMVDELPVLACLAALAEGETRITGAGELRVKESDRISALVAGLRAIGADAGELPDGLVVRGVRRPLAGAVKTHGDHRMAMAFGVLGALPGNDVVVDDPDCVAVSYPEFWNDLGRMRR